MRDIVTAAAALALFAQPGVALAQASKTKAAAPGRARAAPPSGAELKQANDVLSLFVSAFNSKDVPDQTKAGLLMCLYGNPLGKIARNHAGAMAANKAVDPKSPVQRLMVLAAICQAPLPASDAPAGKPKGN